MTRGCVVILGPVSYNVGAGMTGGRLYLQRNYDMFVNHHYLSSRELNSEESEELRSILCRHAELAGSSTARALAESWEFHRSAFVKYAPILC